MQNIDYSEITLLEIKEQGNHVKWFCFNIPGGLVWREGTNAHLGFYEHLEQAEGDKTYVRHLSLNTLPDEKRIGFMTRLDSSDSVYKKKLELAEVGDKFILINPNCRIPLKREDEPIVIVTMGVAASTARSLIKGYLENASKIQKLTHINISKGDFILKEAFDVLQSDGYNNIYVTDRSEFYKELEKTALSAYPIYYVIGSDGFLTGVIEFLKDKGVPKDHFMIDKKPNKMGEFGL